jgi:hypothetical protein
MKLFLNYSFCTDNVKTFIKIKELFKKPDFLINLLMILLIGSSRFEMQNFNLINVNDIECILRDLHASSKIPLSKQPIAFSTFGTKNLKTCKVVRGLKVLRDERTDFGGPQKC